MGAKGGRSLVIATQPDNDQDKLTVAVMRNGSAVGHTPRTLAPLFSHFLQRSSNKALAQITGKRMNQGGGHGVEAPCDCLYGPEAYLSRLKTLAEAGEVDATMLEETQSHP